MQKYFSLVCTLFLLLVSANSVRAQRTANVLYSDKPRPIMIGIEVGTTFTNFTSATPTYFPTDYPYAAPGDTIHMQFPDGFSPLFAWHVGISGDFSLSRDWGLLGKVNYNERRGNWNSVSTIFVDDTTPKIPITSDLTLLLRYFTAELYARYRFQSFYNVYVAGGLALDVLLSNHYDIEQTIGGPPEYSFVDFRTGDGTGIRSYKMGRSFDDELNSYLGEVKFLAGIPIPLGYRWSLNPEVTIGIPVTQLFSSTTRSEYRSLGFSSTPNPLTLTGILALRYEF